MYECYETDVSMMQLLVDGKTYSRGVVEMEMAFLDTLAVNTLRVGKTEKTLLEEGTEAVLGDGSGDRIVWKAYSFPFQKAKAMFWRPWVSETPAIPSSPQR